MAQRPIGRLTAPNRSVQATRTAPPAPDLNEEVPPSSYHYKGIPGLKVLLMGDAGTGKTHSLHTLAGLGYELFAIFTENCMDVVADIPSDQLHWKYISPSSASWGALLDSAKKINTMAYDSLAKLPHVNRGEHKEYMEMLSTLDNFVDDRTGQSFGSTSNFSSKQVLWIDSLTGLSDMAMNLIAGSKPIKHQGDYGVSMDNLHNAIQKLCNDLACHVVIVGHPTRERDEVTGQSQIGISTIGNKLGPKLPQLFTDVIHTKRDANGFTWSTLTPNATLKARNLPWADKMPPDFGVLMRSWEERDRLAKGTDSDEG